MQMHKQVLILESGRADSQYWKDLWRYRELFLFLAWRDILVRYKQTVLGVTWVVLRPLLIMLIFTVIFGKLANFSSGDIPYPVFVFSALLPWQFLANALSSAGESMVNQSGLISKIYFPRMLIPTSAVLAGLADFIVTFLILVFLLMWYGIPLDIHILMLPVFTLMVFACALGAGLWVAALNIRYRDFRIVVPFVVQFGLYISPVGFGSNLVPDPWRLFYYLNPVAGVIDGFRWSISGGQVSIFWQGMILSLMTICLILYAGIKYFRSAEKLFADVI